jgi:hypothetical protein
LLDPVVGTICVEIVNEESQEVLFSKTQPLSLLARNEWAHQLGGHDLLAAFVLPSDPYVSEILKKARDILQRDTGISSTEGYQSEHLPAPGDKDSHVDAGNNSSMH